ncbi:cobalamin biosynthesis family protein [Rheinheimera aquimaris]|uniref:Cobalamin biosynthesis family protein n=1 Tax=Rheinheimera aquimaris TaxID=412437 RepID=A0ABN1E2B3_9GAMM|nr:cobalamin biosynthesis protein [Rheinheimera aquimaris]MCB5214692.1 cobalamin biosynthesis protein [Rheinheimera aquimaris]
MPWPLGITWPSELSAHPAILLLVVLAARLIPMPAAYHPLMLFRYFAQQLAAKVNPDPERPRQQLYISGSLALLVAWLPAMALLYSLYQFSELPLVLDALLLYAGLDWYSTQQQAQKIQQRLLTGQLTLAREQAKSLLCRKTSTLSEMGLTKALLESLTLRSASHFVGVCLAFVLAGGLGAIGYRLVTELQQQWNPKRDQYRYFGAPASALAGLLTAIPKCISSLLLAIQHGVLRSYQLCRATHCFNINRCSFWLLCCASAALRRSLGGPVYYNGLKQQRSKIKQPNEPVATDIQRAVSILQFSHLYLLLVIAGGSLLQLVWQLKH